MCLDKCSVVVGIAVSEHQPLLNTLFFLTIMYYDVYIYFLRTFLQELAFIRGHKRCATVVCLERTELLSVEREDFFSAKIDECFNADMQRRVEFLK